MKVSILMPTRGRPEMAKEAVASLGGGDIEVLVYFDLDDPLFEQYDLKGVKEAVGVRYGYANLHEYYNILAAESTGDWLMLFNDDALMQTKNWVDIIAKEDHTIPQVLNIWNEQDNLFPLISRAWYEAVGHFAQNTHADSWVQQVADVDGRSKYVPGIDIKHYGEEMNDPTHLEVRDIVRQSSEAYRRMGEQRLQDARNINKWIEEQKNVKANKKV